MFAATDPASKLVQLRETKSLGIFNQHRSRVWHINAYLEHGPQVVAVLATVALLGLALQDRSLRAASAWWFAPLAPVGFAAQEHLEGLAHTGDLPWLLTTPSFLLGLAERTGTDGGIALPMSRTDIADHLGLTIESVSRTLTRLERDGVIALPAQRRTILLRDRAALHRLTT